jgi:bifunctional polynucleotide phosphatase/kinase
LIFCARAEDKYRKPDVGILSLIPEDYGKVEFFVGDAAGRDGDHSDCDILFAKNANIPFFTPEKFFTNTDIIKIIKRNEIPDELIMPENVNILTLVLLVGYPGSGKSSYAKLLNDTGNYTIISRDEIGNMSKCIKETRKHLLSHRNVVIDNLNNTLESRKEFLDVGNELEANCVVIHINTPMSTAMKWNEERIKHVSKIVFYSYRKKFIQPSKDEGIDEIYSIVD